MIVNLLKMLHEAEKDLTLAQMREFENYFIGALSTFVSEEGWTRALQSARNTFESTRAASSKS